MGLNPMQKKARNSFLLGVIITLLFCIIIAVVFYLLVINPQKAKDTDKPVEVEVYTLSQNIKSGQIITPDMLQPITVYDNMVPTNYIDYTTMANLELQDREGNILYTKYVEEGTGENKVKTPKLYINQEANEKYETVTNKEADKNKVLIEEDINGFYKVKKGTNGEGKEYIELLQVPIVAKIDMYANTIVTTDSIAKSNEVVTDDLRYIEYNMLSLPTTIFEGDYIDIRLILPNGQDLIVVSKKEVKSILGDTIGLQLTEGEILMMESAIVESYVITASKLYAIQYVDPGLQQAAVKTYTPTEAVQGLIQRDSNIVEEAKLGLLARFDQDIRTWTNTQKNQYLTEEKINLETGIQEEIENARAAREAYLNGLTSY